MTKLSRHDYDILTQVFHEGYYPQSWCDKPGQLKRLLDSKTLVGMHGSLVLTEFGKEELYRVRSLGKNTQVPTGFVLAPKKPTPAFLKRYGFEPHAYRAFIKELSK